MLFEDFYLLIRLAAKRLATSSFRLTALDLRLLPTISYDLKRSKLECLLGGFNFLITFLTALCCLVTPIIQQTSLQLTISLANGGPTPPPTNMRCQLPVVYTFFPTKPLLRLIIQASFSFHVDCKSHLSQIPGHYVHSFIARVHHFNSWTILATFTTIPQNLSTISWYLQKQSDSYL